VGGRVAGSVETVEWDGGMGGVAGWEGRRVGGWEGGRGGPDPVPGPEYLFTLARVCLSYLGSTYHT